MLLKSRRSWELPESAATPEDVYLNRRQWLKAAGFTGLGIGAVLAGNGLMARSALAAIDGYPFPRNDAYELDRAITEEEEATTYTNFYEFGSSKNIWKKTDKMKADPWAVTIDGMVEKEMTIDAGDLVKMMGGAEERLYRHRCVEAWAMAVPWSGVPLANLMKIANPSKGAKYLRMETFLDPAVAPGQKQSWYPWPYVEGVTIEEANNELAFLATGIYGKPLPNQNGAPIRLVTPWKYGFKCIKSISRFTFTDERPVSFWEQLAGKEYGFWANVNPGIPHPRWPQRTERLLGTGQRVPTQIFNGYREQVEPLYANLGITDPRELYY
ncbi:protein-methionine-sulfoxide reductase catalytic subunit MsrP [Alphaproteobacteria bacterium]|jgi:sulfoxide reductase catalytic subunit YedY|nr:protein-methionine-sulfoxide reductase catalytic subunit MsrP [Alphaproteobacteria bacterium]